MTKNNIGTSPIFYRDIVTESDGKLYVPSIQSEVIDGNQINLYVPYDIDLDLYISEDQYLENTIDVYVDDSLCTDLIWMINGSRENDLLGLKCFVDILTLKRGFHILKLQSRVEESRVQVIPFWKD